MIKAALFLFPFSDVTWANNEKSRESDASKLSNMVVGSRILSSAVRAVVVKNSPGSVGGVSWCIEVASNWVIRKPNPNAFRLREVWKVAKPWPSRDLPRVLKLAWQVALPGGRAGASPKPPKLPRA